MHTRLLPVFEPVSLPLHRLPKQTLHHVWAPKLGRPILLTGQSQLLLWAMLEANPGRGSKPVFVTV